MNSKRGYLSDILDNSFVYININLYLVIYIGGKNEFFK
ncbi:Hypothetical protein RLITU_1494 [Romboutsia lituseburensis]|uniref:Uncharacterized protein n=1 Tax=Romboutsia lituseburensis DSM 797 TaxID=1121325 RepID=A0A1G9I1N8_9FIRM|nr:Hypothetical protein RLITU_1494 [Romboutsia lituseburensis]SDL18956.1 hypothetical protein SAMN04515677_10165 [Romboutsia lituseburensis DSM 797]